MRSEALNTSHSHLHTHTQCDTVMELHSQTLESLTVLLLLLPLCLSLTLCVSRLWPWGFNQQCLTELLVWCCCFSHTAGFCWHCLDEIKVEEFSYSIWKSPTDNFFVITAIKGKLFVHIMFQKFFLEIEKKPPWYVFCVSAFLQISTYHTPPRFYSP